MNSQSEAERMERIILEALYVDLGLSVPEIARRVKLSRPTVRRRLRKYGFKVGRRLGMRERRITLSEGLFRPIGASNDHQHQSRATQPATRA